MLNKFVAAFLLFTLFAFPAKSENERLLYRPILLSKTAIINQLDTVVFNLSKAIVNGSTIEFPVSILSNDTVNALDFSFKYNETDFLFDSIIDMTTYMQIFSFYNPMDSTLRFTSNSFQQYENDSALVSVRFTVFSGQFCANDLRTVKVYLNGEICSVKIVDCIPMGTDEIYHSPLRSKAYPNPSLDYLLIDINEPANFELQSFDGKINHSGKLLPFQKNKISILDLANGIYLLKLYTNQHQTLEKIIIHH